MAYVVNMTPKVYITSDDKFHFLFNTMTLDASIDFKRLRTILIPAGGANTETGYTDPRTLTITPKYYFIYNHGNYELEMDVTFSNGAGADIDRIFPLPPKSMAAFPDIDWFGSSATASNPSDEDCLVTVGLYGIYVP